ncbi:MAG: sugar ABC transporter substrate-binding protein [Chloroflexi bacterium]|nr:sugar ABC transporter substrate-binding protein [Chloroflexota bacterium]
MTPATRATFSLVGLGVATMLVLAACAAPVQPTAQQPAAQEPTAQATAAQTAEQQPTEAPAAAEQPVTIRASMWESAEALEPYNKAKEAFEKQYPNIKVQLESVPQEYGTKLLTQMAAGTAPDVFQLGDGDVAKYVQRGVVEDLEPFMAADKLDKNIFFEGVFNVGVVNGKTYLLTKDFSPLVLYYNKDMFQTAGVEPPQEGWTWSDFVEIARKLTVREGDKVTQWGVQLPDNWGDYLWTRGFSIFAFQNGADFLSPDGSKATGYLNSAAMKEAVQFYVDLVKKEQVAPDIATLKAQSSNADLFMAGKAAMLITGRWPLKDYLQNEKLNFGTAPLPQGKKAANAICWAGFGIYTKSQNKDAAWKWLKFIAAEDGAKEFANYALTAVKSIADEQGLTTDEKNAPIMKGLDLVVAPPEFRNAKFGDCVDKYFKENLEKVFLQDLDVQQALDTAAQQADDCFAQP